jgi:hypothetical protein
MMYYPAITFAVGLLMISFPAVTIMGATTTTTSTGRSDRQCDAAAYADICDCDYYKSVDCKNYYYNNGEGGSYKPKNFSWDNQCAKCCCNGTLRSFADLVNTATPIRHEEYGILITS